MNSDATTEPLPIFVYGTLMMGQPNDHMWQNAVHGFSAALAANRGLYDLGYYPMMIERPGRKVTGQLMRLEKTRFLRIVQNLDWLEGFDPGNPRGSHFRRVQIQVSTPDKTPIMAWTYVGNGKLVQGKPLIEHGDWAKHVAEKAETGTASWAEIGALWDPRRPPGDSNH